MTEHKFNEGDRVRYTGEPSHGLWRKLREEKIPGTVLNRVGSSVRVRYDGYPGRVMTSLADQLARVTDAAPEPHKFETTYRGVKVPETLTNNLGTAEASWFKRGVDAAIEARRVARSVGFGWLLKDYTPAQRAAMFTDRAQALAYCREDVAVSAALAAGLTKPKTEPEYRYFRSWVTGNCWRVCGETIESYAPRRGRWSPTSVSLAVLERVASRATRIREVSAAEVPEGVRSAPVEK